MRNNNKNRKPKIGVIGLKGFPAYGGSARAGENMMTYLKDDFHFVVFNTTTHTLRTTGVYDDIEQIVFNKFFIKSLNTIYYYLLSTFYCLFHGGFDVIHVYHVDAAFIVPLLRLRYRVVSGHRARPQLAAKWNFLVQQYFVFMEWLFFKMPADAVTSVSKPIVDLFQNRTKRKILFIPNGIVFNKNSKSVEDIDEEDFVLFASGRVISSKGAHVMLKALNQLNYKGRVLIIGNRDHSPGYSQELEKLAKPLNVRFIGLIKDKDLLMSYLRKSRMFVFPSFHEGMSNMLLEAVSAQIPVICSDIPENIQVFEEGEVFFFKTGNSDDLAQKIHYVLENRENAEEVARRGYERLRRDYDWAVLAKRYADLYTWLIEHKKPLNRKENAFQGV